jgi:hypothetical protein
MNINNEKQYNHIDDIDTERYILSILRLSDAWSDLMKKEKYM